MCPECGAPVSTWANVPLGLRWLFGSLAALSVLLLAFAAVPIGIVAGLPWGIACFVFLLLMTAAVIWWSNRRASTNSRRIDEAFPDNPSRQPPPDP